MKEVSNLAVSAEIFVPANIQTKFGDNKIETFEVKKYIKLIWSNNANLRITTLEWLFLSNLADIKDGQDIMATNILTKYGEQEL